MWVEKKDETPAKGLAVCLYAERLTLKVNVPMCLKCGFRRKPESILQDKKVLLIKEVKWICLV